jgi:hypothetical protein
MKIENNQEKSIKTGGDEKKTDVHYGENRRSRWQDWDDFRKKPDFNRFKRSGSQPGMWKNPAGD